MKDIKNYASQFIRILNVLKSFNYLIEGDLQSVKTNIFFSVLYLVITVFWIFTFVGLGIFLPSKDFTEYLGYFILVTILAFIVDFAATVRCAIYHNRRPAK